MDNHRPFFSSERERRFWILSLLAVAAVYATLGLASRWTEWLYHQNLSFRLDQQ